jgi:hypothetical protein
MEFDSFASRDRAPGHSMLRKLPYFVMGYFPLATKHQGETSCSEASDSFVK